MARTTDGPIKIQPCKKRGEHDPHPWAMMSDFIGSFRWCPGSPSLDERIRRAVEEALRDR